MLYFEISVENVGPNFKPNERVPCHLATAIKRILPDQNPEVYFKYSETKKFVIKPLMCKVYPTEALTVKIYPLGGMINKGMVTSDIENLILEIISAVVMFIDLSDLDLDSDCPIRTTITACPGISFNFSDHNPVDSF